MSRLRCVPCLLALALSACAIAPAKLSRLRNQEEADMHALLTQALTQPDTPLGKAALGHFIEKWKEDGRDGRDEVEAPDGVAGPDYRVTFAAGHHGAYPLEYFDEIRPSGDFEVRKIKHHTRDGVGAPLLALRENKGREELEAFFPPEAITRALTAVAHPGPASDGVRDVRIDLLCPLVNDTVLIGGQRRAVAADFSVPWAALLARAGRVKQLEVLDMLRPTPRRQPRLYLMEPYDPRKEPLIMIHGLLSSPLAWANLSNELWADESIRHRYQIWHYHYNTSAPALYSARLLRNQLRDLRRRLDPEGDDPAMRRTTLLTHSMGGLVGKALVLAPGDAFWKAAFKTPHETLKLSNEDRRMLNDAFEWQADRSIHRIIFVAVPHRGSDFADNALGRAGSWLTKPPGSFRDFYQRVSDANPGVFTAEYAALGSGVLDSVHALSPRQPTLRILAELPYPKWVRVHSIIGDRGQPGPLENSSDGFVPYTSSHVDSAASEKIVSAGHGTFKHPEAVAEIRRILNLR